MKKTTAKVFIGTSGWSYSHWKDNLYPSDLKQADWLRYYAQIFSTVEINTTFYHLPLQTTIQKWTSQVSKDFLFSIKASRYITHQKRLNDCEESLETFYKSIKKFKSQTGPILFQLPPSFTVNIERLSEFTALLNKKHQHVFEFRNNTWFNDEVYALLNKHKIALCITDLDGSLSPEVTTTDFTYIRLHGPTKAYKGSYGSQKIRQWKKKIESWLNNQTSVYCYFDNDEKGYAASDANRLQDLLLAPTSVSQ